MRTPPLPVPPICELFLLLEPFRTAVAAFIDALEPLAEVAEEGPFLRTTSVYYRPDTDVALLALHLDERSTTPEKLRWLKAMASRADLPLLDPSKLDKEDQASFYREYLPTYRIRVEASEGPTEGLIELARLLDLPKVRRPGSESGVRNLSARTEARATTRTPRQYRYTRSETVPSNPRSRVPVKRLGSAPLVAPEPSKPTVYVRFRRGDAWSAARLRSLTHHRARLACQAPPRQGDRVEMVLGLGNVGAVVTGQVTHVVTADLASENGYTTGFEIQFEAGDHAGETQLITLLKHAASVGVSLAPPPPRAAVRFPVRWPTRVFTSYGELSAPALNLSQSGLFVAPGGSLLNGEMPFRMPLDKSGRSLDGKATVAREVSSEMATERGLEAGYGLRITEISDREVYAQFLDRIRMRTEKAVVVVAQGTRALDLSVALSSAGYAVETIDDIDLLLARLESAHRPPDAAVIDSELAESRPDAADLKRALRSKVVPCVNVGMEHSSRSRAVLDHLLRIC